MTRLRSAPLIGILAILTGQLTGVALHAYSAERTVHGTVYYEGKEPAADAAVQLKNPVTLQVMSQLTDARGSYHFSGLNPDGDYELSAVKKGYRSSVHHVSRFSSKPVEEVDLFLKPERR